MVNLTALDEATVRRAIDLALAKLARPGCPGVYDDFELPNGGTPRSELDRIGIGPEEWLESLVFIDGSRDPVCRIGRAVLTTTPGSRVIRVCPGFARFQLRDPGLSASLIIHESLHALGLGENPPSSSEITQPCGATMLVEKDWLWSTVCRGMWRRTCSIGRETLRSAGMTDCTAPPACVRSPSFCEVEPPRWSFCLI